MWAPISSPLLVHTPAIQRLAVTRLWRAKCVNTAAMHRWLNCCERQIRQSNRGMRGSGRNEGVNMYGTKAINGVPAIQRDGRSVLSVCDQNWEFADWLCALLNELGHKSELLLNEQDCEWLNANDRAFRRAVQHA